MSLAASAGNALWLAANLAGDLRMRRVLGNCEAVQRHRLASYLEANRDTEFGRAHDFATIRSAEDYRRAVPLSDYAGHSPLIERIADGAKRVLTVEPVVHFGLTAGSGGPAKMIPYTEGLKREFSAAISPWVTDVFCDRPGLMAGAAYWSISPALDQWRTAGGIPVGFEEDSAYLGGLRKRFVDAVMAVPGAVSRITDPDEFRLITAVSLLSHADLRLVSVWHPGFLTLLWDWMGANWDALLSVLAEGVTHPETGIALPPRPARARALDRASVGRPQGLWPKLGLISCWGDGFARTALDPLAERFPGVPIQPKGIIATEAFVTFPYRGAYPLAVTSHLFEFVAETGEVLWPWELELGQRISPVVTTAGGLYRYRIDDLLEVTGYLGSVPCLRFVSKASMVSDLCGEKLDEVFAARVLGELLKPLRPTPAFALLAPSLSQGASRYVLYLQTRCRIQSELGAKLDAALSRNPQYALCRRLGQLDPPGVMTVGPGALDAYFARLRAEKGQRLGDIKPLALSPLAGWEVHFAPAAQDRLT